jgi:homoserine dehydrogenase
MRAPCRIGLLGFGTVGSAVARRLTAPEPIPGLELTHIFDRRANEKRDVFVAARANLVPAATGSLSSIVWTDCIDDVLTSDVDVIVEAVGGVDPAVGWIRAALAAGKSVVTSNKQAVAHEGSPLAAFASRQGRQLRFEAAVGGAMPIVAAISGGLAADRLQRIVAILNGTTNAVLSRVDTCGGSIEEALADAIARGWAEADAAADIGGDDARAKLAILCALAFRLRVHPGEIDVRSAAGLRPADFARARRHGGTIRQLASAGYDRQSGTLTAWVAPAVVRRGSLFARTTGPRNAAIIQGEFAGEIQLTGVGAGGDQTAVAVLSDVIAIARDRAALVPPPELQRPARIEGLSDRGAGCTAFYHEDVELYAEAV